MVCWVEGGPRGRAGSGGSRSEAERALTRGLLLLQPGSKVEMMESPVFGSESDRNSSIVELSREPTMYSVPGYFVITGEQRVLVIKRKLIFHPKT